MKLSIIIPTIGRETLSIVLEALYANNNFEKIKPEILVIFDGKLSEDLNLPQNTQLQVFETGKKIYAGGARNLGIEKSTGDILIFIGDDTIPQKNWLQRIYDFHKKFPDEKMGLLGKISWTQELQADSFHEFLENGPQFDFKQIQKKGPSWRHFYTSNISIKRKLIDKERFSNQFNGWGFEDIEFGYRLEKKGLSLVFDSNCEVLHDDPQTLSKLKKRMLAAQKNALIFETLHPELKILPRGFKLLALRILIFLAWFLIPYSQKFFWWREWKKSWIEK